MSALTTLDLETRAEVGKLAYLLDLPAEELADVGDARADDLQRLREKLARRIFDEKRDRFIRLERLTRLLPVGYLARLATEVIGPRLSARIVGEMDPYRAARLARRINAAFVAELAPHVDPVKVQLIVPRLGAELVRDTALILVEQQEYVLMGRFADALSPQALRAVVGAVDDDAVLLKIAFYVEKRDQLSKIVHNIDNDRIARIMRTGTEAGLLPEALSVLDNVSDELKGRLANIMGAQDASLLDTLVTVAHQQRLWGPILRGMSHLHPRYVRKIVNLPAVKNETLLTDLVAAAHEEGLFEVALPLAKPMRPDYKRIVAHAALQQGPEVAAAVLQAAQTAGAWDVLLDLARFTDDDERDMLAGLPILRRRDVMEDVLGAALNRDLAEVVVDIVSRMDDNGWRAVGAAATADGGSGLEVLLDLLGETHDHWRTIASVTGVLDGEALEIAAEILQRRSATEARAFEKAARDSGVWERIAAAFEKVQAA